MDDLFSFKLYMNTNFKTINSGKRWSRKTRASTDSLFSPSARLEFTAARRALRVAHIASASSSSIARSCGTGRLSRLPALPAKRARVMDPQIELVQRVCRLLNEVKAKH
jgi:hypothetical protein